MPLGALSPIPVGFLAFFVAAVGLIVGVDTPAGTMVEPWIDTGNRDAVLVAHETEYSHDTPAMEWTGDYDGCEPGDSSDRLRSSTMRRINYYRAMAGVPTGVVENEEYSRKAQHGALTMSAQGELSHNPHDDFACLTGDGIEAAANSNLYLGRIGPRAIDGYIEDPGERNRDVGHRNTILHPPTREMGIGHVAGTDELHRANALWVFDDRVFAPNPEVREPDGFVAWPPRGFIPSDLVYPRWSFGLAEADFTDATVTMTSGGQAVELEVVARLSQKGYVPAPIIVWEPFELGSVMTEDEKVVRPAVDTTFDIVIDGVVIDGRTRRFDYSVTILGDRPADPDEPRPVATKTVERSTDEGALFRLTGAAIEGARELAFGSDR